MARNLGVFVNILGDPSSLIRAVRQSRGELGSFARQTKQVGETAAVSARQQVAAAVKVDRRLREQVAAYRQIAKAAQKGSREQITAANLAAQAQGKLARSLAVTDREQRTLNRDAGNFGRATRGILAGSGVFRRFGLSIAFASSAFLGTAGLTAAIKGAISAASNLSEQTNKVNVIFGESGRTITEWAKTTASGLGIANDRALEAAGTFGNLFQTVGLAPQQNAELSRSLVKLAADLASFNNASPEETLDALRSGLVGEAEPLRRFGILLSEARVQQEAMRESGVKSASSLTAQQKLLARYALILKDSGAAQGDFARTADGLANASRALSAEIRDTQASLGRALLPSIREITIRLRDWLGDTENQRRLQRRFSQVISDVSAVVRGLATAFKVLRTVLQPLVNAVGGLQNAATLAGIAFVVLKVRAFAAAAGLTATSEAAAVAGGRVALLGQRLKSLPTRVALGIVIGIEATGPAKKLFEAAFGANFQGLTEGGGVDLFGQRGQRRAITAARGLRRAGNTDKAIRAQLQQQLFSDEEIANALNQLNRSNEDIRLRAAARGAFKQADRGRAELAKGLGLRARFAKADLALAKAQLTKTTKDDRAALNAQVELIRAMIADNRKAFRDKTALYNQLAAVEAQIQSLDQDAADKRRKANEKAAAKAKEALDRERAARKKASDAAAKAAKALRDQIQTERDRIGELFSGPFLNPSEAQQKRALGAPTPGSNVRSLIADLKAQIQQFKAFQSDLQKLAKRGAPPQLLAELRQGGLAVAPQVHALASATGGQFQQFKSLFIQRERLAVQAAQRDRPIINLTVIVDKDTGRVKVKTTPVGQVRGRNAGVITGPGTGLVGH